MTKKISFSVMTYVMVIPVVGILNASQINIKTECTYSMEGKAIYNQALVNSRADKLKYFTCEVLNKSSQIIISTNKYYKH